MLFDLSNEANRLIEKGELWAYAPVKQTSTQLCIDVASSHRFDLTEDEVGNQLLHFKFSDLPPYGKKSIAVSARVGFSDVPQALSEDKPALFLGAGKHVETDNSSIVKLAKSLRKEDSWKTVESIFQWITENIQYKGYLKTDRGALYALEQRRGDCTEFACLFTALCRANDIPARVASGYLIEEGGLLHPDKFHNWSECFVNGVWMIADPVEGVLGGEQRKYLATKIRSWEEESEKQGFSRFRTKGSGLVVKMMD